MGNESIINDATVQYARGDKSQGWWAPTSVGDQQIDPPYNTYLYKGLPPTPIANHGLDAIKAVLFPTETDCFYYLHENDEKGSIKTLVSAMLYRLAYSP